MGLIDTHIKKVIELSTLLSPNDIFNIYQLKGALPERKIKDETGKEILEPYTQANMFILFGIEEAPEDSESVIITDENGAPKDTIIILNTFNVKVLFNGNEADFYSLKFKARLWAKGVQKYLEDNNISIVTQNPSISFETEEVAGEFWDKRGVQFKVVIELHFDDDVSEEFETIGDIHTHKQ